MDGSYYFLKRMKNNSGQIKKGAHKSSKTEFKKGHKINLGRKGKPFTFEQRKRMSEAHKGIVCSEETKRKIGDAQKGKKGHNWKGDDVGVAGIHDWLKKIFGSPKECEFCGDKGYYKKYTRLNKKHNRWSIDYALKTKCKYKRKRENFLTLCRKCHLKYDKKHTKIIKYKYYENKI